MLTSIAKSLRGKVEVPGDKSLSHRALILGAMAEGTTTVCGLGLGSDVLSTKRCLQDLGVIFEGNQIHGKGLRGFLSPKNPLDCGNSGTTLRFLMGLLAGQDFEASLIGDASLSKRPMGRVADPLRQMGAAIDGDFAPVTIRGANLQAINYSLPIASAQVKSALLLAALFARGTMCLSGKIQSRTHTEEMLASFGVNLSVESGAIKIAGGQTLKPCTLKIPGDPSSAAFFAAGAALVRGSSITFSNVLLTSGRDAFFKVLKKMGGNVRFTPELAVSYSPLRGVAITEEQVPFLIDEIPLLAILGAFAEGETSVRGASELRFKECDRIAAVCNNLREMGAKIEMFPDGFLIRGPQKLHGASIDSFGDHRIAMAFAIAALAAEGQSEIKNSEVAAISYPNFFETLEQLIC